MEENKSNIANCETSQEFGQHSKICLGSPLMVPFKHDQLKQVASLHKILLTFYILVSIMTIYLVFQIFTGYYS
jgi:hypothetical protein